MDEVQMETLEIDGKNYALVDSLDKDEKKYFYFSAIEEPNDIQILKEKLENGEKFFVSLETDSEFNDALMLFEQKYKENI